MTNGIYLLLGSNLGDRAANLLRAIDALEQAAIKVVAQSELYETAAWGLESQPSFLNQVVEIKTELAPLSLLQCLLETEQQMGRKRNEKWGERLIDIDILYYADRVVKEPSLHIPHPHIQERRFTLVPLCELVPLLVHPLLGKTQQELLDVCPDPLEVRVYQA
ncbi:2-amino-4-hydroxy-6-hydroxymethyldihydropteridine diphosphokinase [Nafulsella turpanensis]|uniref:2-amino-4-hydroxy-6- hydroxymethyldihydropteridine diphosphokinase n=1 Tax=Nafulsella turpanensis TaxID=1265690 RepID=UPI000345D0D1|nr:2-amino-4-hydroxy-6-hydroxymethyldihydropteridine diphosphokinase [Nafulsella turpanensis]